jgi:hypothetical protein
MAGENDEIAIKAILRALRLEDGEDPFALYQEAKISKGALLTYIAKELSVGEKGKQS